MASYPLTQRLTTPGWLARRNNIVPVTCGRRKTDRQPASKYDVSR
ncbi:hypothetical protein RHCRD62_40417 [Rhodococcus sp. RD6.2]|nr:hypothetical protein RHCRD62_40417 [Rhodococcus sp. RD6.2]